MYPGQPAVSAEPPLCLPARTSCLCPTGHSVCVPALSSVACDKNSKSINFEEYWQWIFIQFNTDSHILRHIYTSALGRSLLSPFHSSSAPAALLLPAFFPLLAQSPVRQTNSVHGHDCDYAWQRKTERNSLWVYVYLCFVEHLQVKGLDLVKLKAQGCQRVLLLVGVFLQQPHSHFHLLLQPHLQLQLTLQLLTIWRHTQESVKFISRV